MNEKEFKEWLNKQDYWVRLDKFKDKWPDLGFDGRGITLKEDDEGHTLIPRRDLWRLAE